MPRRRDTPHVTATSPAAPGPAPEVDLTVDGTGLLCVALLLRLRAAIAEAEPGTVVHVITTDPAAPLDLPAWCHMTGHHYLGPVLDDEDSSVYALRLAADARPTRADAPWRTARPSGDTGT
ncbi:sulfurtransferase TusA family protein [Streptomyces sp. Isolate_219]|uniref:sulfurtransferase TusA family protein n=1 Tax=Streptomyces sp. Isolate_219 TaxID=2950110 RepID=UPI0021C9C420|nr:sulfurtransferase TusA family protein [Streptomyces sp. Isolate_219]MCR8573539.1 sulfurtransferase TusA family protein [Streptomyces sp. Isolate_219]